MSKPLAICLLCTGSACAKRKEQLKRLRMEIANDAHLVPVKCQKICKGPVVGLHIEGKLEWFSKVRKVKDYEALKGFLRDGSMSRRLKKSREKKR